MLEKISKYVHEQMWMPWAKNVIKSEKISQERINRWTPLFVPYEELSESEKDKDREFAKGILNLISEGRTDHHGYNIRVYP